VLDVVNLRSMFGIHEPGIRPFWFRERRYRLGSILPEYLIQ
jgi:hypothetical protein